MTPTDVQMKIADLQSAILSSHPQMPNLLREIHQTLRNDPETVTLLTDTEIGTIVTGLQTFTGSFITAKAVKAPSARAALKNISSDDL